MRFRISMDTIENLRVREKGTETGLGAKVDRPAAVFDAREISRIGVAEDPSAKGNKTRLFLCFRQLGCHSLTFWSYFCDEDFIGVDAQPLGWFGRF